MVSCLVFLYRFVFLLFFLIFPVFFPCSLVLVFVFFVRSVITEVMNNCTLGERKNMNLPGAIVDLPTLTEKVRASERASVFFTSYRYFHPSTPQHDQCPSRPMSVPVLQIFY